VVSIPIPPLLKIFEQRFLFCCTEEEEDGKKLLCRKLKGEAAPQSGISNACFTSTKRALRFSTSH
jgi:hypothetical protein